MTALTFEDVDVEGIPADAAPETDADIHVCKEPGCTNEVFRRGTRGRWPSYCDDHKKAGTAGKKGSATRTAPLQAKQAAAVLGGMNDMIVLLLTAVTAIPALPVSFPNTAMALAGANEGFMEQAEAALSADPALCRSILRAGKTSGKMSLAMAYGVLGVSLAPGIMADIEANKGGAAE